MKSDTHYLQQMLPSIHTARSNMSQELGNTASMYYYTCIITIRIHMYECITTAEQSEIRTNY